MNCSSSLSSLVCIVSAGFACAATAQTLSAAPTDAPVYASSTLLAPVPSQRSAQAAATRAAAEPSAAASAAGAPAITLPATAAVVQTDTRARGTLRRPLVPGRPHRPREASAPADDGWRSDTLYASPYARSPYAEPGDPD